MKRLDIYIASLVNQGGSIQMGTRPVVIVSNDKNNEYSPNLTVVPLTSKMCKRELPTHIRINGCGLSSESLFLGEQIMLISKDRLGRKIGSLKGTAYETKIGQAIKVQLGL